MYFKLLIKFLFLNSLLAAHKPLITKKLTNQFNKNIDWNSCNLLIIGSRNTRENCKMWTDNIKKEINSVSTCSIASIPSSFIKNKYSKIFIRKSVLFYDKENDIFLDWHNKFINSNNIKHFPTIIIIKNIDEKYFEIERLDGKYSKKKNAFTQIIF